jgi:N-carbamoylputrescine amidase
MGMPRGKSQKVRVAAVQMESKNGLVRDNLEHATPLVERAAQQGAALILLPEFMPCGYIFTTAIWDGAEPKKGLTVQWLCATSKRLGIYLGTSFLEADGEDFFNTFVLAAPDGQEAGRVRKQTPAAFEAFFTKGGPGPHVIDTGLGKIGVGICYENQLSYLPQMVCSQTIDLMLMPHSYPKIGQMVFSLRELAPSYARLFGVPAIVCNKSGPFRTGYPGVPFYRANSSFPGLSTIADSDGTIKAQVGDEEGVIVEEVTFDPERKIQKPPQCYGRWALKGPWFRGSVVVVEAIGRLWYTLSLERKRKARLISSPAKQ